MIIRIIHHLVHTGGNIWKYTRFWDTRSYQSKFMDNFITQLKTVWRHYWSWINFRCFLLLLLSVGGKVQRLQNCKLIIIWINKSKIFGDSRTKNICENFHFCQFTKAFWRERSWKTSLEAIGRIWIKMTKYYCSFFPFQLSSMF